TTSAVTVSPTAGRRWCGWRSWRPSGSLSPPVACATSAPPPPPTNRRPARPSPPLGSTVTPWSAHAGGGGDEEAAMAFVQIIEYQTTKPDEMRALGEEFQTLRGEGGEGERPQITVTQDRDRENTYLTIVRFSSYEAAMENSQ